VLILDGRQLASEINSKVNIAEIVGRYVQLTRSGRNHKGLCPFHNEATPSFLVSEEKGIYKCFGCGEGGDAISFFSKMEGISYGEALTNLASDVGVDATIVRRFQRNNQRNNFEKEFEILKFAQGFYQYYLLNTAEGHIALAYLASRGITKEIVIQFGIGLAPRDGSLIVKALASNSHSFETAKNAGLLHQSESGDYYSPFKSRIMFQVTNEQGHTVGFSGRTYLPGDDSYAKYVNSPESRVFQKSQIVYNLHEARKIARTSGRILLFEGFMDVIAAHKAGFVESVATMGTALTAAHARTLSRHAREVILVFDGDKAGLAATSKAIPILFAAGLQVRIVHMTGGLDPDDYVMQNGVDKFAELVKHSLGAIDFQYQYLKQGLRLETTDGQVEFERRLMAFSNQLPDKSVGQILLRRLRNEVYEQRRDRGNKGRQQQDGLYPQPNKDRQTNVFQPVPKLQVTSGDVKAEKELIYYMLLDKKVFELVMSQIGTAFNIDTHRKVVQAIEAYYVKNDVMNQEEFFSHLDPLMRRVVRDVVYELKSRPQKWSKEMIIELTDKVQMGAKKLAHAGKKQMFYNASYDEQLRMMGELTVDRVVN
jgi:DNA primase